MDFSLIEYTLWVMVAFWSLVLIDNIYAKVAGGLLLALAFIRALLEPDRPLGSRSGSDRSGQSRPPAPGDDDQGPTGAEPPPSGGRNVF